MFEEQRKCACCGRLPAWSEPQLLCADNRTICGDCFRLTNLGEIPMTDKNTLESMRQINSEFYLNRIKAHNDYVAFGNKPGTQVVLNGYLLINTNDKTFAIGQNSKEGMLVGFQAASYADINNISIDDSIQTKAVKTSDAQSGAAEALMGGLFFGTVGAIVGGLAGRTEASYDDVKGADNIGFTVTYNNTSHEYFNVLKTCLNREFVNYESEKEWFDFAKELTVMICDFLNELVNNTQQKQIGNTNANNFLSSGVNVNININPNNIEPTLNRIEMYIEDGEWDRAGQYCEAALDYFPKDYRVYLYSLFSEYHVDSVDMLLNTADISVLEGDSRYKRVLRFGDDSFVDDLIKKTDERRKEITIQESLIAEQKAEDDRKKKEAEQSARDEFMKYIDLKKRSYKLLDAMSYDSTSALWDTITGTLARSTEGQLYVGENKIPKKYFEKDAIVYSDQLRLFLLKDGTVHYNGGKINVSGWKDIVDCAVGNFFVAGLKSDGTVVTEGKNNAGQREVSDWKDIVQISAGVGHLVGLRSDGTVVAKGHNVLGQCDVSSWNDIISIAANGLVTVGLKSDGTVVIAGGFTDFAYGQLKYYGFEAAHWKDIVEVSAGEKHLVGLKSDGTVETSGFNNYGQINVSGWKDIIEVAAGRYHTIGLRKDGRVLATGLNDCGQCNVSDWKVFDDFNSLSELVINREDFKKQMAEEKSRKEEELISNLIIRLNDEKKKLEEELPNVKGLFANSKKNQIMGRLQEIEEELEKYKE